MVDTQDTDQSTKTDLGIWNMEYYGYVVHQVYVMDIRDTGQYTGGYIACEVYTMNAQDIDISISILYTANSALIFCIPWTCPVY